MSTESTKQRGTLMLQAPSISCLQLHLKPKVFIPVPNDHFHPIIKRDTVQWIIQMGEWCTIFGQSIYTGLCVVGDMTSDGSSWVCIIVSFRSSISNVQPFRVCLNFIWGLVSFAIMIKTQNKTKPTSVQVKILCNLKKKLPVWVIIVKEVLVWNLLV